ncbi:MAG: DEAD/DEAH box helicase family protein [Gallionella sp.]|nr:DEAD/DEAH box helicase family protein [Gallionella sp.]
MNEADTRAQLIDPLLAASGWGVGEAKVLREFMIAPGKIQAGGAKSQPMVADYVLVYRQRKVAVIEAKRVGLAVGEGVAQAKRYAEKLCLAYTYACNGREIYQICMSTGEQGLVTAFPTPDALWAQTFSDQNAWREKFDAIPFESVGGSKTARYYQEIAVAKALQAIAESQQRILLTLATGTGKTFIAFQVVWKLFQTRWNLKRDGSRRPRILFLADRNILANQAFNAFSALPEDALVRIKPEEISKRGAVPMNGSVFFTIFQTFMSGPDNTPYFGQYPADYFDCIIVDECHRGGANDESSWREILNYFAPAVQIGLTATPKRKDNADTYRYFGEPVYVYSLKEGTDDGFLTPFKVKRIKTTLDDYVYTSDDTVLQGQVEAGKLYVKEEFNTRIFIQEREAKLVKVLLSEINQQEKTLVFCANQAHAAMVRDLINQHSDSKHPSYCVRVTANDGELGEQALREFQDNDKTIPTILTTSHKLSTGVDARNVRNIVLLRAVNNMIEFKQIIGRGTRLFDGKRYFTIYDYFDAYQNFLDPEWDGEPIEPVVCSKCGQSPCMCEKQPPQSCKVCGMQPCICIKEPPPPCEVCLQTPCVCQKVIVKLRDGKELEIQHTIQTMFWGADGQPLSALEFLDQLNTTLPSYFNSEAQLREIWSNPLTRKTLLDQLAGAGYGQDALAELQKLVNAEKSDLFDVLEYIAYEIKPITRDVRAAQAQPHILHGLSPSHREFLEFVLFKYIETGFEELNQTSLPHLLDLKYGSLSDAAETLGSVEHIRGLFFDFQKQLYAGQATRA